MARLRTFNSLPVLFAYLIGLVASLYLSPKAALAAAVLMLATVMEMWRRLGKLQWSVIVVISAFCCLGWGLGWERQQDLGVSPSQDFQGRTVTAEVTLVEVPRLKGVKANFAGQLDALDDGHGRLSIGETVQVELYCHEQCQDLAAMSLDEGSRIEVRGRLKSLPSDPEADFDYGAYLHQRGINSLLTAGFEQLQVSPQRRGGLSGLIDGLRRHARDSLRLGSWGPASSLLSGMVLGDADQVPEEIVADFRDSGLLHLMAVSGQNVVLLGLVVLFLGRMLLLPRWASSIIAAAFIAVYIPLAGAGPSIVRAGIVGILALAAWIVSRPTDRYRFLALAAAVILSLNPYSFWDPGFQLSFASVLAIFWLTPFFGARLPPLPPVIKEAVAISLSAALATAPISLAHFQQLPLTGIAANVIAAPAAAPVMLLGTLAILLAPVSGSVAWLLDTMASLCTAFLIEVAAFFAAAPGAVYRGAGPGLPVYGLYYGLLALLPLSPKILGRWPLSRSWGSRRLWLAVLALVVVLLVAAGAFASGQAAAPTSFTASFFDVGQGDAALIQAPDGAAILIDGGPDEDIVAWLKQSGIESLDAVIASHGDADHLAGLLAVLDHFPVKAVYDSGPDDQRSLYRQFREKTEAKGAAYTALQQGQRLDFGDLALRVYNPRSGGEPSANAGSLVLTASYHGLDILYPGDAEGDTLSHLDLPEVEVLKVSHHGSQDSYLGQVLSRTKPLLAVISVGRGNPYGHPTADTQTKLGQGGATVLRTDERGTIKLTLGERGIEVSAEY